MIGSEGRTKGKSGGIIDFDVRSPEARLLLSTGFGRLLQDWPNQESTRKADARILDRLAAKVHTLPGRTNRAPGSVGKAYPWAIEFTARGKRRVLLCAQARGGCGLRRWD